MAKVPEVFNQPGAAFVLLPAGSKFPPIENEWQNHPHTYQEATGHKGNVGIMAASGFIGLDQDDPSAFEGLDLPATTTWETRPGRLGMWLRCAEGIAEALATIGKKPDLAQLKLYKNGNAVGELKLQRTYQVIPPSWKTLDDKSRVDYKMLDFSPPAEISISWLLGEFKRLGITFSSKSESSAAKLGEMDTGTKSSQRRIDDDEAGNQRYAEAALKDEAKTLAKTPEGARNDQLNRSAFNLGQFVAAGILSESEVISELSRAASFAGLEPGEIERTIRSGLEAGSKHPREIPENAGSGDDYCKPDDIQVNARYLHEISEDAINALVLYNRPPKIFVRSGHLSRLVTKGRVVIEPLNESALRGLLARAVGFKKFEGLDEDEKPVYTKARPPLDVVRDILSLGNWPDIPDIEGIIETPAIRPDGTIIIEPGYDKATRLYFVPISQLQDIQMPEPKAEDAKTAAKHILDEILADFPFKDEASRANALGLLLTVIVRPMLEGPVPLALIDKPQAGTGASFLAEVVAMIATGRPASMMGAPETEDEWRKSITSSLIDGSTIIVIDNVIGKLQSAPLTRALTSRTWRDRFLGKSEMLDLPQRAVWIATGNNISIGGDLARRSYWIRMDASMARPWMRTSFKHEDLLGWIRSNHSSLLSDLLVMAISWIKAGRPAEIARKLGGFSEWSHIVGGILEHSGVIGFLANSSELYDSMDQDVQQWDEFLDAWTEIHGDHPISAGQLRDELISSDPVYLALRDVMPDDISDAVSRDRKRSLSLGHVLRKHLDQIYPSGRKLCQEKDSHIKTSLWKVCGICGNPEKEKSASTDPSAGIAGFSPISRHFSEKGSESIKCIEVEQNPAIPAKWSDAIEYENEKNPAKPQPQKTAEQGEHEYLAGIKPSLAGSTNTISIKAELQQAEEDRKAKEEHSKELAARYTKKPDPDPLVTVRFNVDYNTTFPRANDPNAFDNVTVHEGDTWEVPASRAKAWVERGIVTIVETPQIIEKMAAAGGSV